MAYYSKLTPSDNITAGDYGYSLAVGNDKIAVGANLDDIGGVTGAGSVYIYNIDGTGEVKISGSDITGNNAAFGSSVSIGNSKLAVGATGAEQVYVYDLDGTNEVILNTSQTLIGGYGDAVVIFDGKLYVGAPSYNTGKGAVFVYELSNLNQTPVELQSSDSDVLSFGDSISVGGNRIVIGAPGSNNSIGRVYVYDLQGQNEYKLNPSDQPASSAFGTKVAIGSGKIVSTSPGDDVGSAYIYNIDGSGEIKITQVSGSSQGSPLTDNYGTAVAIGSSKVIVGAHDFSGYPYSVGDASKGGAFVYGLDGLGEYYFWPADAVSGDHFGYDLQIYDGYLISSSIYKPSVYVYDIYPAGTTVKNLSSTSYTGTINGATFNSAGYFVLMELIKTSLVELKQLLLTIVYNGGTFEVWLYLSDDVSIWNWGKFMSHSAGEAQVHTSIFICLEHSQSKMRLCYSYWNYYPTIHIYYFLIQFLLQDSGIIFVGTYMMVLAQLDLDINGTTQTNFNKVTISNQPTTHSGAAIRLGDCMLLIWMGNWSYWRGSYLQ
jgi:signal peptidase I